jgi:fumarate hydratase class II
MGDNVEFRIEHDTMGEVKVPRDALWRAQTQRAVENFPISGRPLAPALVHALAQIKASAAVVNAELGVVDAKLAEGIVAAADRVSAGEFDAEFPIDVFQTGSGTSTNMNVNEVLATLATRALDADVHPNDHVNASQSSNDTFPSAIHVAATAGVVQQLLPALDHLAESLARKGTEFAEVVKSGRTHLMDATPVTLGQEFDGYAAQIRRGADRVRATLPRVAELPLGGTAVGTGINQGARDALVELSGQLKTIAVSLTKICNDLRWMGSGPRAGLGEIALPDLQPGSSIMPGKVNPVICEATLMVAAQVIGNDTTITVAGAGGNFELNVMLPVIARNLLESIELLTNSSRLLAERCVDGITANVEHARALAESSPSIVTPLNRYIGYENAAAVAKSALKQGKTIREVVIENGHVENGDLTEAQLDAALDVLSMTRPGQQ